MEGKLKVWIRRVWTLEMVSHFKISYYLLEQGTNLHSERYWFAVRKQATEVAKCLIACMGCRAYMETGSRYPSAS